MVILIKELFSKITITHGALKIAIDPANARTSRPTSDVPPRGLSLRSSIT
jgi:hypothetical protein